MKLFLIPSVLASKLPSNPHFRLRPRNTPFSKEFLEGFIFPFTKPILILEPETEDADQQTFVEAFGNAVGKPFAQLCPLFQRLSYEAALEAMGEEVKKQEAWILQIHCPGGKDWAIASIVSPVERN